MRKHHKTIDELEMLNPFELGRLLITEVKKYSPDVQYIQDLLFVGCPIDARDGEYWTALHLAARYGRLEVVKFLISVGVDVNARDNSQTPLHWAAACDHLEMVKFLLSKGADIHARNYWDRTPWDYASLKIKELYPELEPKCLD